MGEIEIGVIGGSGVYQMPGLEAVEERFVSTPFGEPSDALTIGTLFGERVAFLPRHGRGHVLSPSEVPYRANVYAMKHLGVRYLLAISACGSLREAFAPGHMVIPDQLYDHTKGTRAASFFGQGLVAHVSAAQPFSPELGRALADAGRAVGGVVHDGGTYITIEGPRFSTRAESLVFRQWGMDIIGMTTSPEAYLALEAEMAFAVLAQVTDYDAWHDTEAPVSVEMVKQALRNNPRQAQDTIRHLVQHKQAWAGEFAAHRALQDSLITHEDQISAAARARLAHFFPPAAG